MAGTGEGEVMKNGLEGGKRVGKCVRQVRQWVGFKGLGVGGVSPDPRGCCVPQACLHAPLGVRQCLDPDSGWLWPV